MRQGLITDTPGIKTWYKDDMLHREDGPAVELADGFKMWYKNGLRHREDGPAAEWPDGTQEWYIDGEYLNENDSRVIHIKNAKLMRALKPVAHKKL